MRGTMLRMVTTRIDTAQTAHAHACRKRARDKFCFFPWPAMGRVAAAATATTTSATAKGDGGHSIARIQSHSQHYVVVVGLFEHKQYQILSVCSFS